MQPPIHGATFVLTEQHIKLLRAMYVNWQDCETGAPEIDPKRPYGNSDVAGDVAEILGYAMPDKRELAEVLRSSLLDLHAQTATALQIVLQVGSFTPGVYRKTSQYIGRGWELAP